MTANKTRAHAEYRFQDDRYGVYLMIDGAIASPALVFLDQNADPNVTHEPWLLLPGEAMHALYDAIGRALGKHTCNEEVLREALRIERQRTSQLLDAVTGVQQ